MLEIFVVSDDVKLFSRALKFWVLFLKGLNNGEEFLVIDFIITFLWCILGGKEGDRPEGAIFIILGEYAAGSLVGGVSFNNSFVLRVKVREDGSISECIL